MFGYSLAIAQETRVEGHSAGTCVKAYACRELMARAAKPTAWPRAPQPNTSIMLKLQDKRVAEGWLTYWLPEIDLQGCQLTVVQLQEDFKYMPPPMTYPAGSLVLKTVLVFCRSSK